jgi:hypothetical protein
VDDVDRARVLGDRRGSGDQGESEGAADGEAGASGEVMQSHRCSLVR